MCPLPNRKYNTVYYNENPFNNTTSVASKLQDSWVNPRVAQNHKTEHLRLYTLSFITLLLLLNCTAAAYINSLLIPYSVLLWVSVYITKLLICCSGGGCHMKSLNRVISVSHLEQHCPPRQQRRQVMRRTEMKNSVPTRKMERITRRKTWPSFCSFASNGISCFTKKRVKIYFKRSEQALRWSKVDNKKRGRCLPVLSMHITHTGLRVRESTSKSFPQVHQSTETTHVWVMGCLSELADRDGKITKTPTFTL